MLTQRDLYVAKQAIQKALTDAKLTPLVDDVAQHVAIAVINAVDAERSPVVVGRDIVTNLLRPQ